MKQWWARKSNTSPHLKTQLQGWRSSNSLNDLRRSKIALPHLDYYIELRQNITITLLFKLLPMIYRAKLYHIKIYLRSIITVTQKWLRRVKTYLRLIENMNPQGFHLSSMQTRNLWLEKHPHVITIQHNCST